MYLCSEEEATKMADSIFTDAAALVLAAMEGMASTDAELARARLFPWRIVLVPACPCSAVPGSFLLWS
jgi:hypothetical protein